MGAMAAIHLYGLCIPEAIAVHGSTVDHHSALEHGCEAVRTLNELLHGRPSVLVKTLETPLVIRESCGAAPKD